MRWLHYHPDGRIYIREDGNSDLPVYSASLSEFSADYGSAFPTLPAGAAQIELHDGVVYCYDLKGNELSLRPNPAPFQAVLSASDALIAAMNARKQPAQPPTAAQLIDLAFPQTGTARVLFEALFELANDTRTLRTQMNVELVARGQPAAYTNAQARQITRAELKTWLESKLP